MLASPVIGRIGLMGQPVPLGPGMAFVLVVGFVLTPAAGTTPGSDVHVLVWHASSFQALISYLLGVREKEEEILKTTSGRESLNDRG